jgi:Ca2+-binding EF-hand superfamily protein
MSEEACLVKMFKFLDLKDKGAVDFALFEKTAEKMGMYFPSAELQQLFTEYDEN